MSYEKTLGLSLEPVSAHVVATGKAIDKTPVDGTKTVPPAVVCVSTTQKRLQLDQWFPASPIGSGELWPPESRVADGFSRRMPIGLLWDLARREQVWKVDTETSIDPMEAIGQAAADSVREFGSPHSVGLVIPNSLKQDQQQTLLNVLSGTGIKWRLSWLPIAAATYWIDRFIGQDIGKFLRDKQATSSSRQPVGQIHCFHLGLFGCEHSLIELIAEPDAGKKTIIPARKRTSKNKGANTSYLAGFMSDLLLEQVNNAVPGEAMPNAWRQMWATPWIKRKLANWKGQPHRMDSAECPPTYDPEVITGMPQSNSTMVDCQGIAWPTIALRDAKQWIEGILQQTARENRQIDGAIVTGELASIRIGGKTLGELFVGRHVSPSQICVAGHTGPDDLLATGAAEQCRRIDNGEPSFLTKLPLLRTVISRTGEPEWISLLSEDDAYVMGGKRWARSEPVTGLSIPSGKVLTLAIDHEDLEKVRESQIAIPSSYKPNQRAELHVAITPGQGNARVELRTTGMARTRHPVVADLSHMAKYENVDGKTLDAKEYLADYPRLAPSLLPRLSNLNKWIKVKSEARILLNSLPSTWTANLIGEVRTSLREKYNSAQNNNAEQGRNTTAIGSNGRPPDDDMDTLRKIVDGCLTVIHRPNVDNFLRETALRCIAYTSFTSPELESFIDKRLVTGSLSDDAELRVVGNCLRSPETIARFLENCDRHRNSIELNPHQTRAIAELTSYRAEALRYVSETTASNIFRSVTRAFENSNSYGGIDFRYRTMSVAFMLRRRIFDESFVPNDSDAAIRVKEKCIHVLDGIHSQRINVMGGSVNLPAVMRQLIKYIDRKGRGPFLWSA
ncbi:hypothetical protein K227x_26270 [Rubripirellula lacrimiformis]|uniref:Uncharacterized protein n=1 Tax=Rubripirellula lacrimiformis TaxID=1930273 RepID=A0A517NAS6_9BACT|nr:hypothetical protein [Rubripirellula lacrimiformis]QDT04237.1 hypothetical protein K227x_26270 [Rubripirellula lacrimiformis]